MATLFWRPGMDAPAEVREMLDWGEDYDGEGAPAYAEATWRRARDFYLRAANGLPLPAPRVLPGGDGSFHLRWDRGRTRVTVNIPADPAEPIMYSTRMGDGAATSGTLDEHARNFWLFAWLRGAT